MLLQRYNLTNCQIIRRTFKDYLVKNEGIQVLPVPSCVDKKDIFKFAKFANLEKTCVIKYNDEFYICNYQSYIEVKRITIKEKNNIAHERTLKKQHQRYNSPRSIKFKQAIAGERAEKWKIYASGLK